MARLTNREAWDMYQEIIDEALTRYYREIEEKYGPGVEDAVRCAITESLDAPTPSAMYGLLSADEADADKPFNGANWISEPAEDVIMCAESIAADSGKRQEQVDECLAIMRGWDYVNEAKRRATDLWKPAEMESVCMRAVEKAIEVTAEEYDLPEEEFEEWRDRYEDSFSDSVNPGWEDLFDAYEEDGIIMKSSGQALRLTEKAVIDTILPGLMRDCDEFASNL